MVHFSREEDKLFENNNIEAIIKAHYKRIIFLSKREGRKYGMRDDDAISCGLEGVVLATKTFKRGKAGFSSYYPYYITSIIVREALYQRKAIKLYTTQETKSLFFKFNRHNICSITGNIRTDKEIAELCNVKEYDVKKFKEMNYINIHSFQCKTDVGETYSLEDKLTDGYTIHNEYEFNEKLDSIYNLIQAYINDKNPEIRELYIYYIIGYIQILQKL